MNQSKLKQLARSLMHSCFDIKANKERGTFSDLDASIMSIVQKATRMEGIRDTLFNIDVVSHHFLLKQVTGVYNLEVPNSVNKKNCTTVACPSSEGINKLQMYIHRVTSKMQSMPKTLPVKVPDDELGGSDLYRCSTTSYILTASASSDDFIEAPLIGPSEILWAAPHLLLLWSIRLFSNDTSKYKSSITVFWRC